MYNTCIMSNKKIIIGKKYNSLIVLGNSGKKNNRGENVWIGLCNCGKKTFVTTYQLNSGKKKSCGCLKSKDLINEKFGRLLVIRKEKYKIGSGVRWLCLCDCGNKTIAITQNLFNNKHKSCGCGKKGKTSFRYKEKVYSNGYALISVPDHPRANKHTGRVREHIVIMEKKLKRFLLKGEEIHHKNGNRKDNRINNLELWCKSQPSGQRVQDLIFWAKEILKTYEKNTI